MADAAMPVEQFAGFPPEATDFYRRLAGDNSKEFWQAHKKVWERSVRDPLRALLDAVDPDPDAFHLFRPYRDVRFSPDKSPYKMMLGAGAESRDGTVRYVQIGAQGLIIASGCYAFTPDQIARFRTAIDHEHRGARLIAAISELAAADIAVESGGAAPLKTAPRGYPKDHPRIELLRFPGPHRDRAHHRSVDDLFFPRSPAGPGLVELRRTSARMAEHPRGATRRSTAAVWQVSPPAARPHHRDAVTASARSMPGAVRRGPAWPESSRLPAGFLAFAATNVTFSFTVDTASPACGVSNDTQLVGSGSKVFLAAGARSRLCRPSSE